MYRGSFVPPSMGVGAMPIPIAGAGTLELTEGGLVAKAFASTGPLVPLVMFVVTLGAGFVGAYLVTKALSMHMSAGVMGGVIAGAVIASAAMPRSAKKDRPLELVIPWASITKVVVDKQTKAIVVTVKNHTPKGKLHFKVADAGGDPQAIVNEIETKRL